MFTSIEGLERLDVTFHKGRQFPCGICDDD